MILCLRFPFFAANILHREQHLSSEQPLIILRRGKVIASNELAVHSQIVPGLTERQARGLLPDAVFLPEAESTQQQVLDHLLDSLSVFTPLVEYSPALTKRVKLPQPRDTHQSAIFYLDFENLHLMDTQRLMAQIAVELSASISITVTFGLARNKFTAFAAALCASSTTAICVPSGEEAPMLASLPVSLLPAEDEVLHRLQLLGLTTMGQVAALPLSAMLTQFGKPGFRLHTLARGQDNLPVRPHRFEVVERVLCKFDNPVNDRVRLEAVLQTVAIELSARLQAKGCMGRTLGLHLHLDDFSRLERNRTLRQAVSGTTALSQKLLRLLETIKQIPHGVVTLEVVVSQIIPFAGQQLELFIHQTDQRERLKQTLGSLTLRYDAKCFLWIIPVERTARRIEQRYRLQSGPKP